MARKRAGAVGFQEAARQPWPWFSRKIALAAAGQADTIFPLGIEKAMLIAQAATQTSQVAVQTGIGLGAVIAVVCSWQRNRSILWAILAGILGWFYVIYFAATRRPEESK